MISESLQSILEMSGFAVEGTASSICDAASRAQLLQPEIILLDSHLLPDGMEGVLDRLLEASPEARIVILVPGQVDERLFHASVHLVAGVIGMDSSADSLVASLREIASGPETTGSARWPIPAKCAGDLASSREMAPVKGTRTPIPPSITVLDAPSSLLGLALFALNVALVLPLFQGGYTRFTGSIESAFITDARFISEHGLFTTWNPLWYLGFPFHLFYTPLLTYLAAMFHSLLPDLSIPSAYRATSALCYALGPVTLFFFTRYLTRRVLTALICAIGYSVLPSAVYLIPGLYNDAAQFGYAPWQLVVMVKYGEGPHIASLTVTPLAALFFLRALRQPSAFGYVLAGLAIALVALINWIGLFALALILLVLLLSEALLGQVLLKLARASLCIAIAYGLSAFWYNISFIRPSLAFGGEGLLLDAPHIPIILGVVLIYALAIFLSNKPEAQAQTVVGLWLLAFGTIVLARQYLGISLAPQPIRYTPELSMGAILAAALVLTRIHDLVGARLATTLRPILVGTFLVVLVATMAYVSQPFLLQGGRSALLPHENFGSTSEYRVAQWLSEHGGGEPAYATGSHAFWLNVETDVPQLRGGTDQGATNPWWAHASYQINTGEDGDLAVLWLRALGIRWLVVNYPESTDAYKDYAFPHKFDALLPRRYLAEGTAIFEVPLARPGMVQVVDARRMSGLQPIRDALDVENLSAYVDAVDSLADIAPAVYQRPHPSLIEIDAELAEGQSLLVRTTFDRSWTARVDGQPARITPDVVGFMLVEVPAPGYHHIRLEHVMGLDVLIGYLISGLTVLGFAGYFVWRQGSRLRQVSILRRISAWASARNALALIQDAAALAALLGFSAFLARDLFAGENLLTGYGDWTYHAYRIKSLQRYGFLTWTNDWSGGFPLWQSYQFVPHVATLVLQWLTGWPITKAMVFVTGVLFLFLRLVMYGGLRLSGFAAPAALIGSLLTLPVVAYSGALSEFSLLWGVTLFPIVIFSLAGRAGSRRHIYLAALVVGFGAYVHPILALVGVVALACRFLTCRDLSWREMPYVLGIVVLASAFYWLPTIFGDKPAFTNATALSYTLKRSDFLLPWLGLSPSLIIVALGTLTLVVRGLPLGRTSPQLFTTVAATLAVILVVLLLSFLGIAPRLINLAMPQRWIVFTGILLAILGAFCFQSLERKRFAPVILAVGLFAVGVDSARLVELSLPPVLGSPQPESALIQCLNQDGLNQVGQISYADRLVSASGLVPELSYAYFGKVRLVGNYFAQGAVDILYPPLMWLLLDQGQGSTLERNDPTLALAYMRAAGGTLLIVPESEPIAQALLPGGTLEGSLRLRHRFDGFALFEPPTKPPQAFVTSVSTARDLLFPDSKYDTEQENKLRDQLVLRFAAAMDAPETVIPQVSYPSQTEVKITASAVHRGGYLIVLSPYDKGWEAQVNGKTRSVERAGPHYVGIDISDLDGTMEVHLRHGTHWTSKAGIALVAVAFVLFAVAFFPMLKERDGRRRAKISILSKVSKHWTKPATSH